MPWRDNPETGENIYSVSIYAKEELPTWDELYNQFLVNNAFIYDPENPGQNKTVVLPDSQPETIIGHVDLYWKIPHRKILMGLVCNQLNKVLFEDGNMEEVLEIVHSEIPQCKAIKTMRFVLLPTGSTTPDIDSIVIDNAPPIYTCELPTTGQRSVFASTYPSININSLDRGFQLVILITEPSPTIPTIQHVRSITSDEPAFIMILKIILSDVIEYFSGNTVGWKDNNGNVIPGKELERRGCNNNEGIDPAI